MSVRRLWALWAVLIAATGLSGALGESAGGRPGTWAVVAVLGLAGLKGALILLDFMELRHAPALWRRLLLGWLAGVLALLLVLTLAAG
jgi:hypothetical protein